MSEEMELLEQIDGDDEDEEDFVKELEFLDDEF